MPGAEGGWVLVKDSVKRARPDDAPYPAGLKARPEAAPGAAAAEEGAAPAEETPAEETPAEEKKDD